MITMILTVLLFGCVSEGSAKYNTPRIAAVFSAPDVEDEYEIDKGPELSLFQGNVHNVYRQENPSKDSIQPAHRFIGWMKIRMSQKNAGSVGVFIPVPSSEQHSVVVEKPAVGNIVSHVLVIRGDELFDQGTHRLKPAAAQQFRKMATFVRLLSPRKLIIEGCHADPSSDSDTDLLASKSRADVVGTMLCSHYEFISPEMIQTKGMGNLCPRIPIGLGDKYTDNRIEVIAWE